MAILCNLNAMVIIGHALRFFFFPLASVLHADIQTLNKVRTCRKTTMMITPAGDPLLRIVFLKKSKHQLRK